MIRLRRPQFLQGTLGLAIIGGVLLLIGGGVAFAKLGGVPTQSSASDIDLQKGLVGEWKFDNNVKDSTPYSTVCSPQFFTPNFIADRKGKTNSALTFSSGKLGLDCGQPIALRVPTITMSAWVEPTGFDSGGSGIESYGVVTQLYFNASGHLGFQVHDTSNVSHTFLSPSAYSVGSWYHVVATYDGSTVILYVNDVPVLTTSYTGGIGVGHYDDAGNDFLLANYGTGSTTRGFLGALDDIRIYNWALPANEVTALYNQYGSGTKTNSGENGLVGWWKLNGDAKDATPYGHNGTVNGATSGATDREGNPDAYSFNGGSNYISLPNGAYDSLSQGTVSAWIKMAGQPSAGGNRSIISSASTTNSSLLWSMGVYGYSATDSRIYVGEAKNGNYYYGSTTMLNNTWYHLVVTASGSSWTLYVNGVPQTLTAESGSSNDGYFFGQVASGTMQYAIASTRRASGPEFYFGGSISDVRIYNHVLSAAEITNLYNSYNSQISLGGSGQAGSVSLGAGLIGYWPFNGNARDATPYSDDGTVSGAILTTDRKSRNNSAYGFNGTSSGIYIPNSAVLNLSGPMTLSAWVNPSSLGGFTGGVEGVVQKRTTNNSTPYELVVTDAGAVQAWWNSSSNGWQTVVTADGAVSTGQFTFITLTRDASQSKIYINGVSEATGPGTGDAITTSEQLNIGGAIAGSYSGFAGAISDVRIYNRALNLTEVRALYQEYQ